MSLPEPARNGAFVLNDITLLFDDRTGLCITEQFSDLIEKAVREVLSAEGVFFPAQISISFVNNNEIKGINAKFRRMDKATDVLSFPLMDFSDETFEYNKNEPNELGDIIISYEKALEQAKEYGHSIEREIAFLTAHSVLHLLGYDHMDEGEEKVMIKKQEEALEKIGMFR